MLARPNMIIAKGKSDYLPFSLFFFLPAQVPDNDEQFVPDFQSENCKCDLFSFDNTLKCIKKYPMRLYCVLRVYQRLTL